jgi:2,3-bisphosphoglycerate-dependent phosphoglycerate mutase
MKKENIETYNTTQGNLLKEEKIILSVAGERRAELLSKKDELKNIDVAYASNCVRTLQTAKYLLEDQNLKVNIDERLDERRVGKPNDDVYPDWFIKQYFEPDFKTEGGESQRDVQNRVSECFNEIINKHKGKRIAIYSHGYAITFFLLKYCKLLDIHDGKLKYEYNGKLLFDKTINAPELFKFTLDDDNNVVNIELIEFDDIPFDLGI